MNITYTIVDYVSSNVNVYTNKPLSVCKPHTHKFYILRHCIFIVMFVAVERISYDELG